MSQTAMVLAAHGSRHQPAVADMLRDYAARIHAMRLVDEVTPAFHQGEPSYATVLDELEADDITVVPFFTSEGFYTTVVLPRELSRNKRFPYVRVRQTAPVGTHPGMVELVAARVRELLQTLLPEPRASAGANAFQPEATTLAVIGHGTERHPNSRNATVTLARRLARSNLCAEVIYAFLDEKPLVESIPHRASQPKVIVVPFLIGEGPHAARDLPRRLGVCESTDCRQGLSARALSTGKPTLQIVICDRPVGADPRIVDLVVGLELPPRAGASRLVNGRAAEGPRPVPGAPARLGKAGSVTRKEVLPRHQASIVRPFQRVTGKAAYPVAYRQKVRMLNRQQAKGKP